MRRRQYRTVITVLAIIVVVLLAVIALQAIKIRELTKQGDFSANVADTETVSSEEIWNTAEMDSSQGTSADAPSQSEFMGTWVDGSNILTIQADGTYTWINVIESENVVFMYKEGYINESNVMIITRSFDYSDSNQHYQSIDEIPESVWNTEKRADRTIFRESSETLKLSDSQYHFLKMD